MSSVEREMERERESERINDLHGLDVILGCPDVMTDMIDSLWGLLKAHAVNETHPWLP